MTDRKFHTSSWLLRLLMAVVFPDHLERAIDDKIARYPL